MYTAECTWNLLTNTAIQIHANKLIVILTVTICSADENDNDEEDKQETNTAFLAI
jgi:hypothetical protein